MQSTRFQSIAERITPSSWRNPLRRLSSSSSSSRACSFESEGTSASGHSVADTINSVIVRVPSIANLEAERRDYPSELGLLEPRPIVYWGSMEQRMGSLAA